MSLINDHTDRQIEEFAMSGQTMASAAKDSLMAMVNQRQRQAERIADVIKSQKASIASLQVRLAQAEQHNAQLTAENVGLLKSRQSLSESHRRLHLCFVSLLKSVEDHCGDAIGVEQRVEAMIQAQDFGVETGNDLPFISHRMTEFLNLLNKETASSDLKIR